MPNRSEKPSLGQNMHKGVREAHPCPFSNRKVFDGREKGRERRKRDVQGSRVRLIKKRADGCSEKNSKEKER